MTFDELDARDADGFIDAFVLSIALDYQNRVASLELNMRGNQADSPGRNLYNKAMLTLRGFYYFSIESPDPNRLSYPMRAPIVVDGLPEDPSKFPLFERLKPTLPTGAFCCRFFVHNWNSFIHVAAEEGAFAWMTTEGNDPFGQESDHA
jgi:hypothetical protein